MQFREEHEIHSRKRSMNRGVGLVLAAFVALVFGLTVVKVSNLDFSEMPGAEAPASGAEVTQ
ncbi:hypothetical protein GCM10011534_25190 [Pseudooceanicola nanhaiensis]|uniref:Cytochrome C oxidase assembly protein n=1 Tax=Pseudooceanicola nanhaiensis TaxID=375761 RepID=A0A917SZ73_9RHOB|nr:hypothetical protein [Pseudooceanicola nanhaiensis]GGM02324.1 hypothetical protein GCM10011534_25190 [Pseudooceanicola nanhaiensis]